MKYQALFSPAAFRRTLVAVSLAAAYSTPWALPVFTFNPGAAGVALVGAPVTADNILISDFSTVTNVGTSNFTETGFLSVTGFQLGGTNVVAGGLNSTYSLYYSFSGTGHLTTGTNASNPNTTVTAGVFDTLTYSLIGASGNATFGFSGTTPTVNSTAPQVLATGSLINGNVVSTPANGNTAFVPSANASVTFQQAAGKTGFFSPQPFYDMAFTAFTNTVSTVQPFAGGFSIVNGGGSVNFAQPIPEPETYALMLAGLGVMGWLARRRKA